MDTAPQKPLPPGLRLLQQLVTALMVVMILGFVVLVGAFVMRINARGPELPPAVTVPAGAEAVAFTQGTDWFAVVVRENGEERIRIHDSLTGRVRQELRIEPEIADAP